MQATLNDIQHCNIDGGFTATKVPGHFVVIWSQRDNSILQSPLAQRLIESRAQMVTACAHASHHTDQTMPGEIVDLLDAATHTMGQVYRDAGLDEEHAKGRTEANGDLIRNAMINAKIAQRSAGQTSQMTAGAIR